MGIERAPARLAIIGAGYSGRLLAELWVGEGHDVVGVTPNPADAALLAATGAEAVIARGDDEAAMRQVLAGRDGVVVLLSGDVAKAWGGDLDGWRADTVGTASTIATLLAGDGMPRRVVAGSSTNVWGSAGGAAVCDEECTAIPHKPTDAIVLEADEVYLALNRQGITSAVLRIGHIYDHAARDPLLGVPNMPGRTVPYPPDSAACLIHADDVAHAAAWALRMGLSGVYNLVDDTPETRGSFYNRLCDLAGLERPEWLPAGGQPGRYPNDRLKATGYQFQVPHWDWARAESTLRPG